MKCRFCFKDIKYPMLKNIFYQACGKCFKENILTHNTGKHKEA